jgi:hypothetical protein
MPRPKRLFVSHATVDRRFLNRLSAVFKEYHIPFWYSAAHIRGAQQWHDEIGVSLAKCDWFLLLLSPAAVRSKWVKRELLYALQEDRYEKRIVPIIVKPCNFKQLSWTLASFQFVDFSTHFETGCRDLLRIWQVRNSVPKSVGVRSKRTH